jgi:hypothetical protein
LRIVLREQRLFSELLLQKDGGTAGCIRDTRTCVGMEVRVCTGGGQSQRRAGCGTGPAWTGCCMRRMPGLEYAIRVYECGCKDLGEDGQLCMVLLGRVALLSWHKIVPGWWSSRQQGCNGVCRGSKSCGDGYVQVCALVHTRCTQQGRFLEALTVRLAGFPVDVGDQDF